jgi:hypothetical protein
MDDFMNVYHCDKDTAQQALNYIEDTAINMFWEDVAEEVMSLFGKDAKPVQFGRSGGWLSISTLRDMTAWEDYDSNYDTLEEAQQAYEADTKALASLEEYCRSSIKAMAELDYWAEFIADNKLAEGWYCQKCGAFHQSKEGGKK